MAETGIEAPLETAPTPAESGAQDYAPEREGRAAAPPSEKSLDELLAEFEASVTTSDQSKRLAEPTEDQGHLHDLESAQQETMRAIEGMQGELAAMHAERRLQSDRADFDNIVKIANEKYADQLRFLPEGYTRQWLVNEAMLNPELAAAFDNRYSGPEALAAADRAVDRAISKMSDEIRKLPDPDLTADRDAVEAFILKHARASDPAPEDDATYRRRVSRMSNAEFEQHKREIGL